MKIKKRFRLPAGVAAVCAVAAVCLLTFASVKIYTKAHTVTIHGVSYGDNIDALSLSGSDISLSFDELFKLRHPKELNLSNTGLTAAQYDMLCKAYPDCDIQWSVPLGDTTYSSSVETLTLNDRISPSDLQHIRYFTHLQTLDVGSYPLCDELYDITVGMDAATRGYAYSIQNTLYGAEITQQTEQLDLSGQPMDDLSEFYQKLRFFPNIREIYVGDCQASDEEMDTLNLAFPDTKMVWLVEFGSWQVRTDIKVFSTLIGALQRRVFTQEELYPLTHYCTDLVALDLGHNRITDISGFDRLTNLEILVISYMDISDLSVLRNFPKLHFLEIRNCAKITDLSPLENCTHLEQLEMQHLGVVNHMEALKHCTKLSLIFGKDTRFSDGTWEELQSALPDCLMDRTADYTKGAWPNTDKNLKIREAFENWERIIAYHNWDDVTYSDAWAS